MLIVSQEPAIRTWLTLLAAKILLLNFSFWDCRLELDFLKKYRFSKAPHLLRKTHLNGEYLHSSICSIVIVLVLLVSYVTTALSIVLFEAAVYCIFWSESPLSVMVTVEIVVLPF